MSDPVRTFIDVPAIEERAAAVISDSVLMFMRLHEEQDHGGLPCWDERCNVIAFLCHRTGIKSDQVAFIAERLKEYELQHEENCPARTPSHAGH